MKLIARRTQGYWVNGAQANAQQRIALAAKSTPINYTDEAGVLLSQVVRYEPKDFRQRRPNGYGGWD